MKGSNPMLAGIKRKARRVAYKQKSSDRIMQNNDSSDMSQSDLNERRSTRKQLENKRK